MAISGRDLGVTLPSTLSVPAVAAAVDDNDTEALGLL